VDEALKKSRLSRRKADPASTINAVSTEGRSSDLCHSRNVEQPTRTESAAFRQVSSPTFFSHPSLFESSHAHRLALEILDPSVELLFIPSHAHAATPLSHLASSSRFSHSSSSPLCGQQRGKSVDSHVWYLRLPWVSILELAFLCAALHPEPCPRSAPSPKTGFANSIRSQPSLDSHVQDHCPPVCQNPTTSRPGLVGELVGQQYTPLP
jgi:hypothetical protein